MKDLIILGSTGSIGKSALEVVRKNKDLFKVDSLTAGSNVELLIEQVKEFRPKIIGLKDEKSLKYLSSSVYSLDYHPEIYIGECANHEVLLSSSCPNVLLAIVGVEALLPFDLALKLNKKVLLANKEALVCAGEYFSKTYSNLNEKIVPVDSEHSSLYQLLKGENYSNIRKLVLTASGGPFLHLTYDELKNVTPSQAMKHPNWSMGGKISIDSATMINKALEIIEAYWLFNLYSFPECSEKIGVDKIDVIIHPQSIVHAFVEFIDGVNFAHLSIPNMQGPISYAMSSLLENTKCEVVKFENIEENLIKPSRYTETKTKRIDGILNSLSINDLNKLTFIEPNAYHYEVIKLSKECILAGSTACTIFNCANELAVSKFINKEIKFTDILNFIRQALNIFSLKDTKSIMDIINLNIEIKKYFKT